MKHEATVQPISVNPFGVGQSHFQDFQERFMKDTIIHNQIRLCSLAQWPIRNPTQIPMKTTLGVLCTFSILVF